MSGSRDRAVDLSNERATNFTCGPRVYLADLALSPHDLQEGSTDANRAPAITRWTTATGSHQRASPTDSRRLAQGASAKVGVHLPGRHRATADTCAEVPAV